MFRRHGDVGSAILDIVEGRNGYRPNLFVLGYVKTRDERPGLRAERYIDECLTLGRSSALVTASAVRRYCEEHLQLEVIGPDTLGGDTASFHARAEEAFELIRDRREQRRTYRSEQQVRVEAEVVVLSESVARQSGEAQQMLCVSNTRILDGLPGFPHRVTIGPDGLAHWTAALRPTGRDEIRAFKAMVFALYQEGVTLFDRAAFRRVFHPLVAATSDRFAEVLTEHRERVEEILGPDPSGALEAVDDLAKPLVLRGLEGKLADRLKAELEAVKRLREREVPVRSLSSAEQGELARLRGEKAQRRAKALRRKRGAASRPGRKGRKRRKN
jgi:hypothetical protein